MSQNIVEHSKITLKKINYYSLEFKYCVTDTTYIKVLSLHEGVQAELSLLLAPVTVNVAVSHHNPLLHPGIHVEGDGPRSAHHEVDSDSAAQICRRKVRCVCLHSHITLQ